MNAELLDPSLVSAACPSARPGSERATWPARSTANPFTASVRLPVRRVNKEYLRALRAAELALWERVGKTQSRKSRMVVPASRLGLPSEADRRSLRWETACYASLAAGAGLALLAAAQAGVSWLAH